MSPNPHFQSHWISYLVMDHCCTEVLMKKNGKMLPNCYTLCSWFQLRGHWVIFFFSKTVCVHFILRNNNRILLLPVLPVRRQKGRKGMLTGLALGRGRCTVGLQMWIHFGGASENPVPQIYRFLYRITVCFDVRELLLCDLVKKSLNVGKLDYKKPKLQS